MEKATKKFETRRDEIAKKFVKTFIVREAQDDDIPVESTNEAAKNLFNRKFKLL